MNTEIKFMQTGGVPLTNDLLDVLQNTYDIYNCIAPLAGNLTIIAGCELSGSYVNPGVVAIDGEVLPFVGGVLSSTVYINIESQSETFQDQTDKILIVKKTVQFGTGSVNYNWSDFTKLETLKEIQLKVNNGVSQTDFDALIARVEVLELKTAPIINGGVIWAFGRPVSEIPNGWKECLDIRGKTVVGLDPNDPDFATLKGTLGEKKHTLTVPELPSHSHGYDRVRDDGSASGNAVAHPDAGTNYRQTSSVGGNQAHNNIQPSIIAYFIEPNF